MTEFNADGTGTIFDSLYGSVNQTTFPWVLSSDGQTMTETITHTNFDTSTGTYPQTTETHTWQLLGNSDGNLYVMENYQQGSAAQFDVNVYAPTPP